MASLHSRLCRYSLLFFFFFAFLHYEILLFLLYPNFEVRIMLDCARRKRICVRGGTELAVVAWLLPMAARKECGSTTSQGAFFCSERY